MNFLSYDKNKRLEFHHKKSCGLLLIVVAFVIAVATFVGGKQIINMPLFSIGYVVSFLSINMNKKLVNKLSTGSSTEFQNKIAKYSVFLLFILMFLLGGPFFATENWRLVWLGALLATALHFFPFYFVHGNSMIVLGILCTINVAIGYIFPSVELAHIAYLDAAIKLLVGVYLLFFSRQSNHKEKSYV